MKRLFCLILSASLLSALFAGCAGRRSGSPSFGQSLPAENRTVEFTNDPGYAAPQSDMMGKMDFELNSDGSSRIVYVSKAVSRTVETGDGTWKITIPDNALQSGGRADITVTPMSRVSNSEIDADYSGVLLEPQGLTFSRPVRLEYTGKSKAAHLVFLGNSGGENIELLPYTETENGFVAEISHFSSAYTNAGKVTPEQAEQFLQKLMDMAEQRLKGKLQVNLPDIDLENIDFKAIKKTREEFVLMDNAIAMGLAAVHDMLAASGSANKEMDQKADELLDAMLKLIYLKIDAFIEKYRGVPEQAFIMYYINCSNLFVPYLQIGYYERMNLSPEEQKKASEEMDARREKYDEVTKAWAQELWDKAMGEIRDDHNYAVLLAATLLVAELPDYCAGFKRYDLESELEDAFAFDLEFMGEINGSLDGVDSTWKIEGKVPLDFSMQYEDTVYVWTGNGDCSFTGYETEGNVKLDPSPSPVEARMQIGGTVDELTLTVNIKPISPDMLVYTDEDGNQFQFGMVQSIIPNLFIQYYDGSGYKFELELHKGEKELTKEMDGELDSASAHYEFRFIHQPK